MISIGKRGRKVCGKDEVLPEPKDGLTSSISTVNSPKIKYCKNGCLAHSYHYGMCKPCANKHKYQLRKTKKK